MKVLYVIVEPMRILSPCIFMVIIHFYGNCACANQIPMEQYLGTWCQGVVPNDVPRNFGPVIAFVSKVEDACGQAVRERNAAPRYVIPFIYSARFVISSNFCIYARTF